MKVSSGHFYGQSCIKTVRGPFGSNLVDGESEKEL